MSNGLPAGWTEAAAEAQSCLRAGDLEGLRLARAKGRRAHSKSLAALLDQARAPRPAPVSPGIRVARRLRRQKAERRRRLLRWLARLRREEAPAKGGNEHIIERLVLARAARQQVQEPDAWLPEFSTPEPRRQPDYTAAWTQGACEAGINAAKMDDEAESGAILDDLQDLGVSIIRHPGVRRVDLSFKALFGSPDREESEDVLPPATELNARINERRAVFEEFLQERLDRGLQVVFTLGPHGTRTTEGLTLDGKVRDPIRVVWEEESRGYLDIRDPDHCDWLETFTHVVCSFLKRIEATIARSEPGFVLADAVHGIELFNEIDMANTVLGDPHEYGEGAWTATAKDWATILVRLARVIEGHFPNGAMRILLPGLSSWDVSEDDFDQDDQRYRLTWTWKISFFRELVKQFADQAGGEADRLAHGVDMHWYHRKKEGEKNSMGPLHISRLTWESEQMYEALAKAGLDIDLTMFETGISVLKYKAGYDYHPPAMADRDGMAALQVYQGQEVVRRLAGAAAGGITVAGWHAWRSDQGGVASEWYGLGLRKDSLGAEHLNEARPRFSWLAFQRFWSLLQSWSSAEMVLPPASFRPVILKDAGIATYMPGVEYTFLDGVVIEFTRVTNGSGAHRYGYLVFLDKWRGTSSVSMTCKPDSMTSVNATWHRMLPSSFDWESEDDIGRNVLPAPTVVSYSRLLWGQVIGASGATWTFNIDSDPILLLTDGRLAWTYGS